MSARPASSQRSVSALELEGSNTSRRSSPTNLPGSTKSAVSRDSSSALSFRTNSAKKSRTKSHVTAEVTDKHQITFTVTVAAAVPAGRLRFHMSIIIAISKYDQSN